MFSIDGIRWSYPCQIERISEITPSEISGLLLDKSYFNDVLGQYLKYDVRIAVPINSRDLYAEIYELLTAPVDGHTFVLPYNSSTVTILGRVENVSDGYVRLPNGGYWKGTRFTVVANHPTKTMTLGEVISLGRSVLPDISEPHDGDTYTYVNGQWVTTIEYDDADAIYF